MASPNTLIFVDLASDDPAACGAFYAEVFGWINEGRPEGVFHRLDPGGTFKNPDGSDSEIGNLHIGVFDSRNARPHPEMGGVEPRTLAADGRRARIWVLIGDGSSADEIMAAAEARGATTLWRNHYWAEFNGYNDAFRDPWGNEIVLWGKAGENPELPAGFTSE